MEDRMSQAITADRAAGAPPDLEQLPPSSFLSRAQVAEIIDFSVPTLKRWAAEGRGPHITYLEGRPRYRVRDLQAWIGGQNG